MCNLTIINDLFSVSVALLKECYTRAFLYDQWKDFSSNFIYFRCLYLNAISCNNFKRDYNLKCKFELSNCLYFI